MVAGLIMHAGKRDFLTMKRCCGAFLSSWFTRTSGEAAALFVCCPRDKLQQQQQQQQR